MFTTKYRRGNFRKIVFFEIQKSQMMEDVVLVPAGKEEFVDFVDAAAKTEGWMLCHSDYECYKDMLGNENFRFMAAKTKSGQYVGSCICFLFPDHAFVAAYYVCPEFRSRGIGTQLFNMVVNNEVRRRNVGLHGAPAMAPVYEAKLGFIKKFPWLVWIFKVKNINFSKLSGLEYGFLVKDIKEVSLEQLVKYDTKFSKTDRTSFIRVWIYERPDAISKVVLNSDNEIVGYGSGHMIPLFDSPVFCPIYGDNDLVFMAIFAALANHFKEHIQRKNLIDMRVPTNHLKALETAFQGIADVEIGTKFTPLFTKSVPEHDIDKIYSITDLTMFI